MNGLPCEFDAFLVCLRDRTEAAWDSFKTPTLEDFNAEGGGGSTWRTGTKWRRGLDALEIGDVERRWNIRFPQDYRSFLSVLNAPDRGMYSVGWSDDPPYGLEECEDEPSFFDWKGDQEALADALEQPLHGLLYDVENNELWLSSWGKRPQSAEGRTAMVTQLVAAAPKLIPVIGHRYLLADPAQAGNPILSVSQSDIIVYGSNLRNFLLLELSELLGLESDDAPNAANQAMAAETISAIPFWGELILR